MYPRQIYIHIGQWFRQYWSKFCALPRAEQYFQGVFWTFFCYLVTFSGGFGIREVLPPLAGCFLIGYYRYNWEQSNLRRFPLKWALIIYVLSLIWAVAVSLNPLESFIHVARGLNKQLLIFIVALESVRNEKDIRRLIWAFVVGLFWQGLNCVYQGSTGFDFIQQDPPHAGRLTGSFGDYWIGNYFALALVPAGGLWYLLRQKCGRAESWLLCAALLWPAAYGMLFASARNALLTLAVSMGLAWAYAVFIQWKSMKAGGGVMLLGGTLLSLGFLVVRPASLVSVGEDGRWDLWRLALKVFQENPLVGVGAGQYNAAFRALDLAPAKDAITISHPHDIYLQLLCETGIIGFVLTLLPLGCLLVWLGRKLHPLLRQECACAERGEQVSLRWRLTFFCALGFVAFLINGIVGHDFYRPWYQALAFSQLGMALGAVLGAVPAATGTARTS